jgi:hypothetical protein
MKPIFGYDGSEQVDCHGGFPKDQSQARRAQHRPVDFPSRHVRHTDGSTFFDGSFSLHYMESPWLIGARANQAIIRRLPASVRHTFLMNESSFGKTLVKQYAT